MYFYVSAFSSLSVHILFVHLPDSPTYVTLITVSLTLHLSPSFFFLPPFFISLSLSPPLSFPPSLKGVKTG